MQRWGRASRATLAAALLVTGRDVEEQKFALSLNDGKWTNADLAALLSDPRRGILITLPTTEPGMTAGEVATKLGKNENTTKNLLQSLAKDGRVKSTATGYVRVGGVAP
jgi:hypothetical protein